MPAANNKQTNKPTNKQQSKNKTQNEETNKICHCCQKAFNAHNWMQVEVLSKAAFGCISKQTNNNKKPEPKQLKKYHLHTGSRKK